MEFENSHPDGTPVAPPMTQEQMQESFKPMQYASSSITLPDGTYRVHTSATEYEEVHASSAYEAMQKTGIKDPFKIARHSLSRISVLTEDIITKADAADAAARQPTENVQAAQAPAENAHEEVIIEVDAPVAMPTEADAESRGLDGDEVSKLLEDKEE